MHEADGKALSPSKSGVTGGHSGSFARLVEIGRAGPHAALIARDVPRAFGAVAPHKRRDDGVTPAPASISTAAGAAGAAGAAAAASTSDYGGGYAGGDGDRRRSDQNRRRQRLSMGANEGPFSPERDEGEGFVGALANLLGGWRHDQPQLSPSSGGGGTPTRSRAQNRKVHRRASSIAAAELPDVCSPLSDRLGLGLGGSPTSVRGAGGLGGRGDQPRARGGSGGRENGGGGFTLSGFPGSPFRDRNASSSLSRTRRPRVSTTGVSPGSRRVSMGSSSAATTAMTGRASEAVDRNRQEAAMNKKPDAQEDGAAAPRPAVESSSAVGAGAGAGGDAGWLARAEAAWEAVPVESKRECLGNVLLAVAARFPDVGYCQVKVGSCVPGRTFCGLVV